MERQKSFAQAEYAQTKKSFRRERFLNEMELVACAEQHHFAGAGREPIGSGRMLRMYFLQRWHTKDSSS